MATTARDRADVWFDPLCPWCWITSRWVLEVATHREIDVAFHVMSLAVLNDGKEVPPEFAERLQQAWKPVRVVAAAQARHGNGFVAPLYTELGTRIHNRGITDLDAAIADALDALGLEPELADAAWGTEFDEAIRTSHHEGYDKVNAEVGTPIVHINGIAFFGPVLSRIARGEDVVDLWDAMVTLSRNPHFFDVRRGRDEEPELS